MIEFVLNTKKDKIEIEYSSKELKDKTKQQIEQLMKQGYSKNTAKSMILLDFLKTKEYTESKTEKGYVFYTF